MAEALDMARIAAEDGVRAVIATPHHADGLHSNPPGKILERLRAFKRALRERGLALKVAAGTELRLQPDVADMVARGGTLLLGGKGRGLLVELSHSARLGDVARTLFQLRLAGVTPILAHVERIRDVQDDVDRLAPLIRMGVLTQTTAESLLGEGSDAERCAHRLLRRGYVHFLASDGHGARRRRPTLRRGVQAAARILGDERAALALVWDNPLRLLRGEPLLPPSVLAPPPRTAWFLSALKRLPWRSRTARQAQGAA